VTLDNRYVQRQGNTHSIFEWGAKCDGQRREDATISAGSLNVVSYSSYHFAAADVSTTIIVGGGNASYFVRISY
jgi:hypothetical protein